MMESWGWIWMLVWIAALMFMVWLIVRAPATQSTAEDAMAILRARFARGEISQEDYEKLRQTLSR